jgi:hypothetical protein
MSLIGIVIVLLVVGVLLWAVQQLPFIDATIKRIIFVLVIVVVAIWLLNLLVPGVLDVRVPTRVPR